MGLADSFPGVPRAGIDWAHLKIHGGESYSATHSVSVGTATNVTVLITAPATGEYHLDFSVEATNSGTWTFSEAPNTSGGTAMVAYNKKRDSDNASTLVHTHTATYVSSGTILEAHCIGTAGAGNSAGGGSGQSRHEYILDPGKLYLVRYVALNAATNVAVNLSYYYEED